MTAPDLVRVYVPESHMYTTMPRPYAEMAGYKIHDRPATDRAGNPLPDKPHNSRARATEDTPTTQVGGKADTAVTTTEANKEAN